MGAVDHSAQIEGWCKEMDWRHVHGVVVVGFTEDKPWEILRRYRSDVLVVCFEPDQKLARRLAKDLPDQRVFIVTHLTDLRTVVANSIDVNHKIEVMGEPSTHPRWAQLVSRAVGEAVRFKRSTEVTLRSKNKMWTEIGLKLLPRIAGKPVLNGAPKPLAGKPAIIVGAGPSLNKNVADLQRFVGHAAIFATNSAVGTLEDAGIQPDFIAAVEASTISLQPIVESKLWPNAVLIPNLHTNEILWDVPCRGITPAVTPVGAVGTWITRELELEPFVTGGSVSTLAYAAAIGLGCSPIILVGMDCAQGSRGTDAYADGVRHANDVEQPGDKTMYDTVTAYGGIGFVKAPPYLSSFREWFEFKARTSKKQTGADLINATEGGARIEGSVERRLRDIAVDDDVCDFGQMVLDGLDKVIDTAAVIALLRNQVRISTDMAERAKEGAGRVDSLISIVPSFIESGNKAHLLSGYSLGPIEEAGALPNGDQFVMMQKAFTRTYENHPVLNALIEEAISAMEDNDAKA